MRRRDFMIPLGAAVMWPLKVRAQHPAMPVIGYLSIGTYDSDNIPPRLTAFRQGLHETGYVEGQNVVRARTL